MNTNFNVKNLAKETSDCIMVSAFNSWTKVVAALDAAGFNRWEAEAFLRSAHLDAAIGRFSVKSPAVSTVVSKYIDLNEIKSGCKLLNDLVMAEFGVKFALELNDKGQPCQRGNPPGNPTVSILVPLGTPACCSPLTEQYWSM